MKTRHFITIAQSYTAKNKLASGIQQALQPLDRTIFPNQEKAKRVINKRFLDACHEYLKSGGKAFLPSYKEYETVNGFGVQITDCMIVHGAAVADEIMQ